MPWKKNPGNKRHQPLAPTGWVNEGTGDGEERGRRTTSDQTYPSMPQEDTELVRWLCSGEILEIKMIWESSKRDKERGRRMSINLVGGLLLMWWRRRNGLNC